MVPSLLIHISSNAVSNTAIIKEHLKSSPANNLIILCIVLIFATPVSVSEYKDFKLNKIYLISVLFAFLAIFTHLVKTSKEIWSLFLS